MIIHQWLTDVFIKSRIIIIKLVHKYRKNNENIQLWKHENEQEQSEHEQERSEWCN